MSNRKNRFARNPLMYIQQPSVEQPKARMQHSYQSSRQNASESNKNAPKAAYEKESSAKRVSVRKSAKSESKVKNSEEEQKPEEQTTETEAEITNERKPRFQDMTLEEKIKKLASSSSQLVPKMRCAVETTGKTYRGIILDYKNNTVYIRSNRMNVEIPFDDIKDARMLGL